MHVPNAETYCSTLVYRVFEGKGKYQFFIADEPATTCFLMGKGGTVRLGMPQTCCLVEDASVFLLIHCIPRYDVDTWVGEWSTVESKS